LAFPLAVAVQLLKGVAGVAQLMRSFTLAGITASDFVFESNQLSNTTTVVYGAAHKLQPKPEGAPQAAQDTALQFMPEEFNAGGSCC
jgi:hypothetical protein